MNQERMLYLASMSATENVSTRIEAEEPPRRLRSATPVGYGESLDS
jgi:hypothetical protein